MHATSFLLALLFSSGVTEKNKDCLSNKSNIPAIKLKNDLFCEYEKNIRPVSSHKSPIHVQLGLELKYFAYEIDSNSFKIDGLVVLIWNDEHLEWDPKEYDSIESIQLPSDLLWIPNISVFNRKDSSGNSVVVDSVPCKLYSNGDIISIAPIHLTSLCFGDISNYPFDSQNCTIRFGSWTHHGEEINITLYNNKESVDTDDFVPNGNWELVETRAIRHAKKYSCCPESYLDIDFSFKITRLTGSHAASVILPALAIIMLTLTSLWIPPDHSNRLLLCCVNLFCEFLYLQHVSLSLPLKGSKVPLILLFARDSLFLSVFAIIFSLILKNMMDNVKPAPIWVANTAAILTASRVGRFLFSDQSSYMRYSMQVEESNEAISFSAKNQEWLIFAKILDRICFAMYIFVYLILHLSTFSPLIFMSR